MREHDQVGSPAAFRPGLTIAAAALLCWAPGRASAQGWPSYAHDQQHSCLAVGASQLPQKIRWSTPVDTTRANGTGVIYIHYGSPVITRVNTVLVPVKTTDAGGFQVEAHSATNGALLWTAKSDYVLPAHDWVPIFGISLTPKDRYVVYPGAGGTVYARSFPDSKAGQISQLAFYGTANYSMNPGAFNAAIQICTPISSDALGNLYFGYVSSGAALPGYPNGIPSGLAKITRGGVGSFVAASTLAGDNSIQKVAYNCSPSFSADGSALYVAVNNGSMTGYLCAVSTSTLAPITATLLKDPTGALAAVDDDGSATPSVGPDGDVYYGVLANGVSGNHYRGYLLHFGYGNGKFTSKLPSAFGWDDTASIVPASAVPSYSGPSSYLLLTKYNNYAGYAGGNGVNQLAVVDPNVSMTDPISGQKVMKTVLTVNGITPDPDNVTPNSPNAVREWCINSAAIDVVNKCAVVNSEDGHVYRWSFVTNTLSPGLYLEPSTSEAYTPTLIGPDGAIYAINDAVLFCCTAK